MGGLREHEGPGMQQFRQRARVAFAFGAISANVDVARRGSEVAELLVGHREPIHPETVDGHAVHRRSSG